MLDAGDAAASVLLLGRLRSWALRLILARAQELAASVVGHRGATVGGRAFYDSFRSSWETLDGD